MSDYLRVGDLASPGNDRRWIREIIEVIGDSQYRYRARMTEIGAVAIYRAEELSAMAMSFAGVVHVPR